MSPRSRLILVVLLGVLVHAPALGWGFFCDDHGILLVLEGEAEQKTMRPWSLYDFGPAPKPGEAAYEGGSFAWWTDEDWSVRFLRPVTSLALMADHALFGRWAPGYHLSGLAWFALLLVLAHALFRALGLEPGTALLATLFLAVEDGGVFPVGWPANRNTPVEAVFVVLALLCVARPKRLSLANIGLALAAALTAALAKESGIAAFPLVGVVLAWRAFGHGSAAKNADAHPPARGDAAQRRLALGGAAASLALGAAYLAFLLGAGYGATCAFYPTPWGAPGEVLRSAAFLFSTAPLTMSGPFPPDALALRRELGDAFLPLAIPLALTVLVGAALLAYRVPRTLPFVALAVLALLPQAGAPTSSRLYFVPMIGFAPLLALLVERWRSAGKRRLLGARLILVSAVGLSTLSSLFGAFAFEPVTRAIRAAIVDAEVPPPAAAGPGGTREALVLNSPTEFAMLVPLTTWIVETGDLAVRFWPLQCGRRALAWTRVDATTFELRTPDRAFGTGAIERVFLAREPDVAAGRIWRTALFTVEALSPSPVRAVRFRLPASLDDPSYAFLAWSDGRLRRIAPPAIGATIELPALEPLFPLMP